MDNPKQPLTTLSLCTGYGGIERGLELAGESLNVLAHVEVEAFAIANLVAKMEEGKLAPSPIWSNLKTLPVEPFRDRVDLITGGYPCQPFSSAGKRAGKDDPRHLWPYISDIIRAVRPVRCFFENVEGHISLGLREVISDLESLGYKTTFGIFSATEVGAPHQRKRVYILADSDSALSKGGSLSSRVHTKYPDLNSAGELADSRCGTSSEGKQQTQSRSTWFGESPRSSRGGVRQGTNEEGQGWPSRPGQEQYDWEEQRTVRRSQSGMGRETDGASQRVDRLRLLGNGVVPQTAAKAWQVLNEEQ